MLNAADLPDDITALKAMLIAATAREVETVAQIARKDERIERLEKLVATFKQAVLRRKSEKMPIPINSIWPWKTWIAAMAAIQVENEADAGVVGASGITKPRAANRGSLPKHLPRIEEVIEPDSLVCAHCGGLHCIGEDVSERLDVVPAQFRVIFTRRPTYACRASTDGVVQAPAPAAARLILRVGQRRPRSLTF